MYRWRKISEETPPTDVPVLVFGEFGYAVAVWRETTGDPYPFVEPYRQSLDGEKYLWKHIKEPTYYEYTTNNL